MDPPIPITAIRGCIADFPQVLARCSASSASSQMLYNNTTTTSSTRSEAKGRAVRRSYRQVFDPNDARIIG